MDFVFRARDHTKPGLCYLPNFSMGVVLSIQWDCKGYTYFAETHVFCPITPENIQRKNFSPIGFFASLSSGGMILLEDGEDLMKIKKLTGQHQQDGVISGMERSGIPEMSSHRFGNSVALHSRNTIVRFII